MRMLRVVALFMGYSTVGFGGDYLAALFAFDRQVLEVEREVAVEIEVEVEREARGDACAVVLERELSVPVAGADLLVIDVGAGALSVEGQEGRSDVSVAARVCASGDDDVERLRLSLGPDGDAIELSAHYDRGRTARIDLAVTVPMGFNLDIDDSSGDIHVSGVGALDIDDSSGSILVAGATGSVSIEDSSGGIEVRGVAGDVEIEDGSGGISVSGIAGAVAVRDGSGGIEIADVTEDVLIAADGSGSIDVRNVAGDFSVDRDGSGSITHSNVAGAVEIPARKR